MHEYFWLFFISLAKVISLCGMGAVACHAGHMRFQSLRELAGVALVAGYIIVYLLTLLFNLTGLLYPIVAYVVLLFGVACFIAFVISGKWRQVIIPLVPHSSQHSSLSSAEIKNIHFWFFSERVGKKI